MNCTQCRKRLQDYLDETLEAAKRAELSAHIAACDSCRGELEALRKVAALVGSLDEVPVPAAFLQGVRERIDRPGVWERFRLLLTLPLRPGFSVAVPVLIVAFVAVYFVMLQDDPSKIEKQAQRSKTELEETRTRVAHELELRPLSAAQPTARDNFAYDVIGPTDTASALFSKAGSRPDADMKGDATVTSDGRMSEVKPGKDGGEKAESMGGWYWSETTDKLGVQRVAGRFESQAGDQTIELVVLDLKTDQSNVEQIVAEEGGQATTISERGNLTGLLLEVPGDNYERAVERLTVYNTSNSTTFQTQQRQQEETKNNESLKVRSKSAEGPPETQQQLPLVVRRLVEQVPAKQEATEQEAVDESE